MALLSLRAYAKHRGCALSAVQKAVKTGRIQLTPEGKIDSEQADALWKLATDHGKRREPEPDHLAKGDHPAGGQGADHPPVSELSPEELERRKKAEQTAGAYASARAAREFHVARIKQLEYEERAGKLLKLEEVEKRIFEATRTTRDAILNIPNRISAELASETDPHRVHVKLTQELTQALEELANVLSGRPSDG